MILPIGSFLVYIIDGWVATCNLSETTLLHQAIVAHTTE